MTYLAHKIELDPTDTQVEYFAKAVGTARYAYNWGLSEWDKQYAAGEKPTTSSLRRQFNAMKRTELPWTSEVSKTAPQFALEHLGIAFNRFFKKQAGRPKFKKKYKHDNSFKKKACV
jgi:putative transposase